MRSHSNAQWYCAIGSCWVCLDDKTQADIEVLWEINGSSWITSNSFRAAVYVDISSMVLLTEGMQYTIARV